MQRTLGFVITIYREPQEEMKRVNLVNATNITGSSLFSFTKTLINEKRLKQRLKTHNIHVHVEFFEPCSGIFVPEYTSDIYASQSNQMGRMHE